ncbi:SH3 domain-binding protein 2 isoform X2 [Pseudophryne corroboree]
MSSGELNWPTPMKAIGAQNLMTMPGGVTISGYLHKRGGKQLQLFKWPLRFVIIHKGCVYYFKSSTSAASQGAFSLNGYNRVMRAAEETTSSNVFPFKMVHISKKHRTWYFSAASEDERKKWMLHLRKEIDHYHEKKETITDLSDTGSDTDSFYGSVERPVDIKYIHNPADDSWQDEDDDEEDYEQPDVIDDSAPSYPPPPVPRQPKSTEENQRRFSASATPKPPSPLPRPQKVLSQLDLTSSRRDYGMQNHNLSDSGGRPPPIPVFPPAHKPGESLPPPLPPLKSLSDKAEKELSYSRREFQRLPVSSGAKPSSPPPQRPSHRVTPTVLPTSSRPKTDLITSQSFETKIGYQQSCAMVNGLLSRELNSRFNNAPPPVPEKPPVKPNHILAPVLTVKPEAPSHPPPIPRNKPKIFDVEKSPDTSSSSVMKPVPIKPRTVPKPPTPFKSQIKTEFDRHGFSLIARSSPDGQSIKDIPMDDKSDSDQDYEKVPLPATVFIDTCDSADVERMFKATDARGGPLNGLFCIRNSARAGKVLVVWDGVNSKLRNYRIFEKGSKVYLEQDILFPDVASLVEHYYESKLPSHENLLLKHAYGCPGNSR